MLSSPVVEDLDVLKAGSLHVGMSGMANTMNSLVFEAVEPTLCWCIVPTVPLATHRAGHAVFLELLLKGVAGVLAAPVRVI